MQDWSRIEDRINEYVGRGVYWLSLVMVLVGAYNAIARYFDRFTGWGLSSNMYIELQWYLFSILFLLGAAYTLKHDSHVRVDVLYGRLSARGKAWINLVGTLVFLFPFCLLVLITATPSVIESWSIREVSPDPGGLPRYPIKSVILIAFVLLILQGVFIVIRQLDVLINKRDTEEANQGGDV